MISVNQRAHAMVRQMIDDAEALGVEAIRLKSGATVLDCGVKTAGSLEAGRLFVLAGLGGLGRLEFTRQLFSPGVAGMEREFSLQAVSVAVHQPHIACLGSQYAGWPVRVGKFSAIGSGPARALYADEEVFRKIEYRDKAQTAILVLETRDLPGEDAARFVAEKCNVPLEQLFLLVAPTASLVGSIQIASRVVETGLHKLMELGFDTRQVKGAYGICPMAPVAGDDVRGIGRTNDAILYGGQAFYTVDAWDEELSDLIERIPSTSSRDYGTSFYELFTRSGGDFFKIDRMLFSPAEVSINNIASGRTFRAGRLHPGLLKSSLLGA